MPWKCTVSLYLKAALEHIEIISLWSQEWDQVTEAGKATVDLINQQSNYDFVPNVIRNQFPLHHPEY